MSTPNEIRVVKNRDAWRNHGWSATPNSLLLRKDISWDAKGAFGWLSLAADDPEFEVDSEALANAGPRGRDHARGMIRELEEHGYLTRARVLNDTGTPEIVYELWPQPVPEEERTFRPSTARKRRKSFPQVSPESLDGQTSAAEQAVVDNSTAAVDSPETPEVVSAGQPRKPGRSGPGRSGPGRSGVLTTSSRKTPSSSFGSSTPVGDEGGQEQEEEEASSNDEELGEHERTARRLAAGVERHLEGTRRYLMPEARQRIIELLVARLADTHSEDYLEAQLGRWCREAHNPSTYLPMQLERLGPPKAYLQVVRDDSSSADVPTWCGQCDPEGRDRPKLRRVDDSLGRQVPCPNCHPKRAAGAERSGDELPSASEVR